MRKLFILLLVFLSEICSAQPITASPKPGVNVGLKQVSFTIDPLYSAHYTADGTTPSKYSQRLPKVLNIEGNTVLRIAYYSKENERADTTFSYFVERAHQLPVVSILTDPDNFFDYSRGIYVKGCCADSLDPYVGANFWKNWERKINITFFEQDGKIGFSQDAGVKIFGGYSVGRPQKSLAIIARSRYGNKRFDHKLFPNLKINEYKSFILRNAGSDMQEAHVRDVFATQLVKNTGLDIQEYRPAAVYLNGEYWGVYNIREKLNEHYVASHYGIDKDSLIIMRHRNGRQHGSVKPYRDMISYLAKNRLTEKNALDYISSQMDIDNFILYNICETYTANGDAGGNIRYFKGVNPNTRWRWMFYDLDMGLNISSSRGHLKNTIEDFTTLSSEYWPNPAWSTFIIRKILENDSLKNRYINQFCDLLNTNFSITYANSTLDRLAKEVAPEIDHHLKRWNISRKGYDKSLSDLRLFINERPQVLFTHLQEKFELVSTIDVEVLTDKKQGVVKLNTLTVSAPFVGKYFKNIPIQLRAVPSFDYDFVGWKGRKEKESELFVSCTENVKFEPVFEKREMSSFQGKLIISEVNAKQESGRDWVEIYNNSSETIHLGGFFLKDSKDDHLYYFSDAIKIKPNDFLIVCEDELAFKRTYGSKINTVGGLSFGFSSKDVVSVYDANKRLVHKLDINEYKEDSNGQNIAINDLRDPDSRYSLENETPGKGSLYYLKLLEQEAEDAFYKKLFFYSGISAAALVLLLLTYYFVRKKKVV